VQGLLECLSRGARVGSGTGQQHRRSVLDSAGGQMTAGLEDAAAPLIALDRKTVRGARVGDKKRPGICWPG